MTSQWRMKIRTSFRTIVMIPEMEVACSDKRLVGSIRTHKSRQFLYTYWNDNDNNYIKKISSYNILSIIAFCRFFHQYLLPTKVDENIFQPNIPWKVRSWCAICTPKRSLQRYPKPETITTTTRVFWFWGRGFRGRENGKDYSLQGEESKLEKSALEMSVLEMIHRSLTARRWKMKVGRLLSFRDGIFSGAMGDFRCNPFFRKVANLYGISWHPS